MKKVFHVTGSTGNDYTVEFSDESGSLKAMCNCRAGITKTLCKHVLSIIETDEEISNAYAQSSNVVELERKYHEKAEEAEMAKAEAAKLKKQLAKILLS